MAAKAASFSHIIRVPRTDEDGSFVLGEVTPSGTSKPLNVKFVATEGEEPYVVKLRHDRIGELRATNSPCSPEEWEGILKSLLLKGDPVEGIEAGAEASARKSIVITIRRRVAGINQRLGALTLNWKEDEAIQLYDWCGAVAQEREKLKEQVISETTKTADLESRIADLRHQLEELTQAKKEREAELLEKFCELLNEKKVKIREQQKLLNNSAANIDSSRLGSTVAKVAQLSVNSSQEESQKPAVSSRSRTATKRKAAQRDAESDSDDDDEFEKAPTAVTDKMDVDEPPPSQREPSPQALPEDDRMTTDDGDATGSEPDDADDEPAPSPPPTRRKPATRGGKDKDVPMQTTHNLRNRSPAPKAKVSAPPPAGGSETESDDEL
ncbi:DNA repair protein XRCC4 [Cladorrhinum sp. PSN332]|nr:DNA repair protein XRCC4 [Cladorrhinum sp. PSN332]